jgi:hypothetical protein
MIIRKLMNRIRKFSKDQGGMEALQTVCIIAIAATILIAAAAIGGKGTTMMEDNFNKLKESATVGADSEGGLAGTTDPSSQLE